MAGSSGRNGAGRGGPGGVALLGSIALHTLAVAAFWFAGRSTEPLLPPMKSYRVNIVSPPPLEHGPPQPGVAAAEPPPPVEAPKPEPTPPASKPEPVVKPEPPKPAPPKPEPPKPEPKPAPKPEVKAPPKPEAKTPPKAETQTPPRTETSRASGAQAGAPSGAPRSTGANPKPGARIGGDGLNIQIDGEPFPFPDYLNNIVIQISRYFRWTGAPGLKAEIYFEILPSGSVEGLRLLTRSGNVQFDVAAMEAVELAGKQGVFGSLPTGFTGDRLPVSFYFEPPR